MTHIITELCLRDGACVEVCPVECIIPGQPESEWPWYFIDPDTCIDCGACVPECPFEAIFPEEDVPDDYVLKAGQEYVPFDTKERVTADGGEVRDLTAGTQPNYDFFSDGPGYDALDM
ncbi:MAG: ferredoxin family protein [Anaerolineae bacterium]|mgnify:FL=1|nr:ferredoxin family protein [Anaerolineae bacterium]MCB9131156.1 ferredoxin family protein [Anaerolineales bacterium]MCB0250151.1 ferredoxin family protein [Anaerolineae bacterium]MCB9142789.1 ferredoxin family protein [Anaerolineales bacterium]MCO5245983.1 ferredoxin family protein [Anaerolineae bacterium]